MTEQEIKGAKEEARKLGEVEGDDAENDDIWYLRKLDGGLFTLQSVDFILGWISMEDDGVSSCVLSAAILELKNRPFRFERMPSRC